jgi:sugar/nucleoside kinase (ribokinase family)
VRAALRPQARAIVAGAGALVVDGNAVVRPGGTEAVRVVRAAAVANGVRLWVDANHRAHRWPSAAAAREALRDLAAGAHVLRVNADEAALLSPARLDL